MATSLLEVIGNIFVYKIMMVHKQHIAPMVITIRKLFTSIVNIIYFNHKVESLQFVGLGLVFCALALELIISSREAKQNSKTAIEDDNSI